LQWKNTKLGWQRSHEEHTSSLISGKEIGEVHSGRQNKNLKGISELTGAGGK
jgi:hypothetical protein